MNKLSLLWVAALWVMSVTACYSQQVHKQNAVVDSIINDTRYAQLFAGDYPSAYFLSPDEQWLIVGITNKYKENDDLTSNKDNLFRAVGLSLVTNTPIQENTLLFDAIELLEIKTGEITKIQLHGKKVLSVKWAPNSKSVAMVIQQSHIFNLWQYRLHTKELRAWDNSPISGRFNSNNVVWLPDSSAVIARVKSPTLPSDFNGTPKQHQATEAVTKNRVYRDLLDSVDKRITFAQLTTQKLIFISEDKSTRLSKDSRMLEKMSISPDGKYLLTTSLRNDLSKHVKFSRLARIHEVFSVDNLDEPINTLSLSANLLKGQQKDAEGEGSRLVKWLSSKPSRLMWVQSTQENNMNQYKDEVLFSDAPFNTAPVSVIKNDWRIFQMFSSTSGFFVYSDWQPKSKQLRIFASSHDSKDAPVLIKQYNYTNKIKDPGDFFTRKTPLGNEELLTLKKTKQFFMKGIYDGADVPVPFIDKYEVESNGNVKNQRIFESASSEFTYPYYLLTKAQEFTVIAQSESHTLPPNLILTAPSSARSLYKWDQSEIGAQTITQRTIFTREDGVQFVGNLYIPMTNSKHNVDAPKKLPLLIWLYPRQTNKLQASQKSTPSNQFISIGPNSPLVALLEGFAVLDVDNLPIVRNGLETNDTFNQQLIADGEAIIRGLEKNDIIDTEQIFLMGHSYGAFGVVSLLAHTDLFKGGIARSGAYNRTLTPLGFQQETRTLWQAPNVYLDMSPILKADQIKEPLLLIHGEKDTNPGTSSLQSTLLFEAIQNQNGSAELVLLPHEGHQYLKKESLMTMVEHQQQWLTKWRQNTPSQPVNNDSLASDGIVQSSH